MSVLKVVVLTAILTWTGCQKRPEISLPMPEKSSSLFDQVVLPDDVLYDKVLGALVGSAIGDAMGASTEMWHRNDIQRQYGYITGLTNATRVKSPEGTWRHNMIAGATTDDTRWKYFMTQYIEEYRATPNADNFAEFIVAYYQAQLSAISDKTVQQSTDLLDDHIGQIDWIKEWARVALAYQKSSKDYNRAQARFYGGEMSCAGMLYAPMFGLIFSEPTIAYEQAFDHALFDIGYAKDISGLTAAMTNMAMRTTNIDSIINIILFVDPYDFKDSRLIGRLTEQIVQSTHSMVIEAKAQSSPIIEIEAPATFIGSELEWSQLQHIYNALEGDQRAIAFHAGEIFQILIAGLYYGEGDFIKTMQFIVNYGRDNDTVAAVAGIILGTKDGFSNLPVDIRDEVLRVNRELIGIDLELLAKQIMEK
jgi:ADP-ribosylglycohydrolase